MRVEHSRPARCWLCGTQKGTAAHLSLKRPSLVRPCLGEQDGRVLTRGQVYCSGPSYAVVTDQYTVAQLSMQLPWITDQQSVVMHPDGMDSAAELAGVAVLDGDRDGGGSLGRDAGQG